MNVKDNIDLIYLKLTQYEILDNVIKIMESSSNRQYPEAEAFDDTVKEMYIKLFYIDEFFGNKYITSMMLFDFPEYKKELINIKNYAATSLKLDNILNDEDGPYGYNRYFSSEIIGKLDAYIDHPEDNEDKADIINTMHNKAVELVKSFTNKRNTLSL